MGPNPAPYAKVAFGPFEFETVTGDLRKFGTRIRLQGKPLQILTLLLERPGEIVGREELQNHLWHGTTFVDFEQGLNSAVNKLRQALNDSPDQPRYIETLPGKGYRFVAPLQNQANRAVLEMAPPAPPAAARPVLTWVPWVLAFAIGMGGSFWAGSRRAASNIPAATLRFAIHAPDGYFLEGSSTRQTFALSPDGTRLVFSAVDSSGASQLFVRDLRSLETRAIPNTRGVHTLFWHPESDAVYVSIGPAIRRVPIEGEGFVAISRTPAFTRHGLLTSPSSLLLDTNTDSYTVAPNGGTPEPIKNEVHWPNALPGTSDLLYTIWDSEAKRHRAVIGPQDQSGVRPLPLLSNSRVLFAPSVLTPGGSFLVYVSGGNLVAHPFDLSNRQLRGEAIPVADQVSSFLPVGSAGISVSSNGLLAYLKGGSRAQLNWVDRSGKRVAAVGPSNVSLKSARLSRDGTKIVTSIFDTEKGMQNLWMIDAESGAAKQLTTEFGLRDSPVWSPDGSKLAYLHTPGGRRPRIGMRGLSENDPEHVEAEGEFQLPTDWSPDGRFIVFSNNGNPRMESEVQGDVQLMDLQRNHRRIPLLHSTFHEANAVFSPDGHWLAFTSNESGRTELYLQAFHGGDNPTVSGERFAVSRSGAIVVRWRRDGKELFYLAYDGKVYSVPVKLGARPAFGAATALFGMSGELRAAVHANAGFDVSADGQRFIVPSLTGSELPSIVVVQNWETGLKQKR